LEDNNNDASKGCIIYLIMHRINQRGESKTTTTAIIDPIAWNPE
jgi:hypothetical protein